MIESLKIKNFRCLRDVEVPLKPFTVLIGPNNTGKTAFLSAIERLGANVPQNQGPDSPLGPIQLKDRWGHVSTTWPQVSAVVKSSTVNLYANGDSTFKHAISSGLQENTQWVRTGRFKQITPIVFYGANGLIPTMQCQAAIEQEGVPLIDNQVGNVPAVLDAMLRKSRKRFDKALTMLKELVPGLEDLRIESPDHKSRRLDLEFENGLVIPAMTHPTVFG